MEVPIRNTAKRFDEGKEKPTVTTDLAQVQRRKVEKLMSRVDKPINIPTTVRSLHCK